MSLMDNKVPIYEGSKNFADTNFKNPQTLAEKILKTPATRCSITMPVHTDYIKVNKQLASCYQVVTIPFYMSSEFGFGLGNEFRELVNIGDNAFVDIFNGIGALTGGSQITPQSEAMSSKVWKGSKFDGFKVDCLFVCTNRNNNPVDYIKTLSLACLPRHLKDGEFGGIDGLKNLAKGAINIGAKTLGYMGTGATQVVKWGNDFINKNKPKEQRDEDNKNLDKMNEQWHDSVEENSKMLQGLVDDIGMVAPLDYGIDLKKKGPISGTTVTLQVGNWFRATQLLVTSISGITFSKEIIAPRDERNTAGSNALYKPSVFANNIVADGFPLYAKCSISLEPSSMMHMDKFNKYFTHSSQLGSFNDYGATYDGTYPLVLP